LCQTEPDINQYAKASATEDGGKFKSGSQLDTKPAFANLPNVIYDSSQYKSTRQDSRNLPPKLDLSRQCNSASLHEPDTDRKCQNGDSVKKTASAADAVLDQHMCQPPRKRFRYDKSLTDYVIKDDVIDNSAQRRASSFSPGAVRSQYTSKVETIPMPTLSTMESPLKRISDFSTKALSSSENDDCPIDYCRTKTVFSSASSHQNCHVVKKSTTSTYGDADKINYLGPADGVAAAGPPVHPSSSAANVQDEINPHPHGLVDGGRGLWCRPCGIWFSDEVLHSIHAGCHAVASTDGGGGSSDLFSCNVCGRKCADRYAFNTHLVRGHVVLDTGACTTPNHNVTVADRQAVSSCSSSNSALDDNRCRYLQSPQSHHLQQPRHHKFKPSPTAAAAAAALEWQMTVYQQLVNSQMINTEDHRSSDLSVTPAFCVQNTRGPVPSDAAAAADWSSSSTAFREYLRSHVTDINRID
jgi:hypothetical protein